MATQDGNSRDSSMMHLFLNCLAASAGAGLTYVRNIVPHLASRTDLRATILLTPALRVEFGTFSNVFLPSNPSAGLTARSPRVTPLLRNYGAGPASQRQ